jgi:hypothetical protein
LEYVTHPSASQQTTGSAAAIDFAPGILASVSPTS